MSGEMDIPHVLVVGAGIAGLAAARAIREPGVVPHWEEISVASFAPLVSEP